jgi:hypothetical protein
MTTRTLCSSFVFLALVSVSWGQEKPLTATVPAFGNADCPITGKKASSTLFAETESGRIYVCCAPCIKKIRNDVPSSHKSAYPVVKKLNNTVCPITGKELTKDAKSVVIQGIEIGVCCEKCEDPARKNHQVTLAKAHDPNLKVVENTKCPVDGSEVESNAIVVIGDEVIRLSSLQHMDAVNKDPAATLKKAKANAEKSSKDIESPGGK